MLRMRSERGRLGLTQGELAKKAGVSKAAISNIETGHLIPWPKQAERIAAALGWEGETSALFEEVKVEERS